MKIECPSCKLTGQTSDLNIPPEGRYMDCPRCKANFFVQKKAAANWADTMTDCPRCGYSSFSAERFDICPQCGLDAKNYNEQQRKQPPPHKADLPNEEPAMVDRESIRRELERLERKEAEKRQQRAESASAPVLPSHLDEPVPTATLAPPPVRYLGWAFMAAAVAVLAYGLKGWYGYFTLVPARVASRYEDVPGPFKLFIYYGLQPLLRILLGLFVGAAAYLFLKMRPGARRLLEAASWSGVAFVVISEAFNMFGWIRRSSDSASLTYYLVGLSDSMLMAALWSAPLLAAIWYLRSDQIRDEFPE
jgi:ribosomal protein L37E